MPLRSALGPAPLWSSLDTALVPSRPRVAGLVRGLLLAIVPLGVFAALFTAADPAFERWIMRLTAGLEELPGHLLLMAVFAWIAVGLLGGVLPAPRSNPMARLRRIRIGIEETAMVLGVVAALFLVFVGLQFSYLFGGAAAVAAASGLTVAEYARRGFFELVAAAGLVLALLLAVGGAAPRGVGRWVFRSLGALLVALVMVVIASAAFRLRLYVDAFGLTVDRLYAAAVMGWITATLLLYAGTALRGRPGIFASGALVAGIMVIAGLAVANPAAVVARTNLARAAHDPVDADYLPRLGADAVPTIVAGLHVLPPADRCKVVEALVAKHGARPAPERDWRRWNAAEAEARKAVVGLGCG